MLNVYILPLDIPYSFGLAYRVLNVDLNIYGTAHSANRSDSFPDRVYPPVTPVMYLLPANHGSPELCRLSALRLVRVEAKIRYVGTPVLPVNARFCH